MLEIPPLSPAYPVIKLKKINHDESPSKQPQHKKQHVLEEQETKAVHHIDEIV